MLDPAVRERLNRAKRKILDEHGHDPNVTAAGAGFRRRAGQMTTEPAVVVMVGRKRPEGLVSRSRLLPKQVDVSGAPVAVDVIEAGPFTRLHKDAPAAAESGVTSPIRERMRPLRAGCSISASDEVTAGTLGCLVRDNTDGTVCVLSSNHVMGFEQSNPPPARTIVQPGRYDDLESEGIATLKRIVPTPVAGTNVDAAIAQLNDQQEGRGWVRDIARDVIPSLSAANPAVGMITLGDQFGNILITRMDATVHALNVTPILRGTPRAALNAAAPIKGVVAPQVGMDVEKVGRTTGYTSSVIQAVDVEAGTGEHWFYDLAFCPYFGLPGDSGSVVLRGASFPCPVLGITGDYYGLNLEQERRYTDRLSHEFMSQTKLGRHLAALPYLNEPRIFERLDGRAGSPEEIQSARHYYDKYHDFLIAVLDKPDSLEVVTQEHLDDAATAIRGLEQTVLNDQETHAAWELHGLAVQNGLGKNRGQIQALMADEYWVEQVKAILDHIIDLIRDTRLDIIVRIECKSTRAVGGYYDLPLEDDEELSDRVKQEFFFRTPLGRLLASLPYVNELEIRERMKGEGTEDEKTEAAYYYDKYHDFMVSVMDDPNSPEVVTAEHLNDAISVIYGLSQTVLTDEESSLAADLYYAALVPTEGMTRRQIVAYMDDPWLYRLVYDGIKAVPTIEVHDPIDFPPIPVDEPAAYWKLDGNGSDSSGNDHPVTTREATAWIGDGKKDGALRLSGGWADTPQPVVDVTESFTVAAWARLQTDPTPGRQWDLVSQGSDPDIGFALGALTDPDVWFFTIASAQGNPAPKAWVEAPAAFAAGEWVHLAGVYDAGAKSIRIYVNGRTGPAARITVTGASAGGVQIGRALWSGAVDPANYWPGDVDEVRLYSHALYAPHITDLAGVPPTGPA